MGSNKYAELILINRSLNSLLGIEVSFRNYRKADDSDVVDVICSMNSVDGKGPRIQPDPIVQTYFRFASVVKDSKEKSFIELTPTDQEPIKVDGPEVGVKFTVAGDDISGSTIFLRIKLDSTGVLTIEPWESGKNAVNPGDPEGV